LIFRKGNKKLFLSSGEKQNRRESAYFWEERNHWFSDIWMDLKGTSQGLLNNSARDRSAAFPFELAYRLICMFSVKHDHVLDPFLGIGTSMCAAMAAARNFIGVEIDPNLKSIILSRIENIIEYSNSKIRNRLQNHLQFVENRIREKGPLKHTNQYYGFPVMTLQEKDLWLNSLQSLEKIDETTFEINYSDHSKEEIIYQNDQDINGIANPVALQEPKQLKQRYCQIKLFGN
jgi:modification methylase